MDKIITAISVEELRSIDFEAEIEGIDNYRREFSQKFESAAKKQTDKDSSAFRVYCLMGAITSMHLKPEDKDEPFGPAFVLKECRSAIISDFPIDELNALAEIVNEMKSDELRARVADLLWLRLRKKEFAELAINSYIKAAEILETDENSTGFTQRIERAIRLSSFFRRQHPELLNLVILFIKEKIKKHDGSDTDFLSIQLIRLLLEFDYEMKNDDFYYGICIKISENSFKSNDFTKAEKAWETAEKCAIKLKDIDKEHHALLNLATLFEKLAEIGDDGMYASHWLQKGVEVLKNIPNIKDRKQELYLKLRKQQELSTQQVSVIESEGINIKDCINNACELVSGKNLQDALLNFVLRVSSTPDYDSLKNRTLKQRKKFIAHHLFGKIYADREGLVVAQVPSSVGLNNDENGRSIWASILESASFEHEVSVKACIEPAREVISLEHIINENSLKIIIHRNPFIKNGHEYLFAKGLAAGFNGDFITAIHILIPQLENSFRYILEQCGVSTTYFHEGIQKSKLLTALLDEPKLIEIFGKNVQLDLKGLLIEPLYGNLRNEIMHGKFPARYFNTTPVIYCWWLILKILISPFYKDWYNFEEE